jgi:hypothetical protein
MISYADDLKLFAHNPEALGELFLETKKYLAALGMHTAASSSHVLQVGGSRRREITVNDTLVKVSPALKFLGIMVHNTASFTPWRDSFDSLLHTLGNNLRAIGLGATPAAWLKAIRIAVLPVILFGCEMWGIDEIYQVMFNG